MQRLWRRQHHEDSYSAAYHVVERYDLESGNGCGDSNPVAPIRQLRAAVRAAGLAGFLGGSVGRISQRQRSWHFFERRYHPDAAGVSAEERRSIRSKRVHDGILRYRQGADRRSVARREKHYRRSAVLEPIAYPKHAFSKAG